MRIIAGGGIIAAGNVAPPVRPLPALRCAHNGISRERAIHWDLQIEHATALASVDSAHLPAAQYCVGYRVSFHSRWDGHVVLEVDHQVVRQIKIRYPTVATLAKCPRLPHRVQAFVICGSIRSVIDAL